MRNHRFIYMSLVMSLCTHVYTVYADEPEAVEADPLFAGAKLKQADKPVAKTEAPAVTAPETKPEAPAHEETLADILRADPVIKPVAKKEPEKKAEPKKEEKIEVDPLFQNKAVANKEVIEAKGEQATQAVKQSVRSVVLALTPKQQAEVNQAPVRQNQRHLEQKTMDLIVNYADEANACPREIEKALLLELNQKENPAVKKFLPFLQELNIARARYGLQDQNGIVTQPETQVDVHEILAQIPSYQVEYEATSQILTLYWAYQSIEAVDVSGKAIEASSKTTQCSPHKARSAIRQFMNAFVAPVPAPALADAKVKEVQSAAPVAATGDAIMTALEIK